MADYRQISQDYAQGGIKAAILINGAAAIAVLSQLGKLANQGLGMEVVIALVLWGIGVSCGAATWGLAFLSTRFVDKSEREQANSLSFIRVSDRYLRSGLIALIAALVAFLSGCIAIAVGFARSLT